MSLLALSSLLSTPAHGMSVTVPDDLPTIQAALDLIFPGNVALDTILVRAADYPERLRCRGYVVVLGLHGALDSVPVVDALSVVDNAGGSRGVTFRNFRIRGVVSVSFPPGPAVFEDCQLDSGIVCILDSPNVARLKHCSITGRVYVGGGGSLTLDSCDVKGWIVSNNPGGELIVLNSILTGPADYGIYGHAGYVRLAGNVIRGFDTGMLIGETDSGLFVQDNVVEDCLLDGIRTDYGSAAIIGNRVARCRTGIDVGSGRSADATVRRNVVLECSEHGIRFNTESVSVVDSNVVGRSGGDGIQALGVNMTSHTIRSNTTFSNAGSGIVVFIDVESQSVIERNIAYGNGRYGLLSTGPVAPVASCNAWSSNVAGSVGGMDSTGAGFSVDPRFCDLANGDARLRSDSALLDWPGCGLIGALGVGCTELTATVVTLFKAERIPEGVRLRWQVAPGATAWEIWLERSETGLDWTHLPTERSRDGEVVVELDREARSERTYQYRLVARDGEGDQVIGSLIVVGEVGSTAFGLSGVTPNPSTGPVEIEFRLAHPEPVELIIFDLAGRRVASLADGPRAAGPHVVRWSGFDARGEAIPPGIYLVRYRQPGVQMVRRIVRVR